MRDIRHRNAQQRQQVAATAASLICEGSVRDPLTARRKAAQRLGIRDERLLPEPAEIVAAVREHQRLFSAHSQPMHLRRLREAAREAMQFLRAFHPHLYGSVLDGTADNNSPVYLQLFCDHPEALLSFLHDHAITVDQRQQRVRLDRETIVTVPVLRLLADEVFFELTVLPDCARRQAPLDRVGESAMQRASLARLERLLAGSD